MCLLTASLQLPKVSVKISQTKVCRPRKYKPFVFRLAFEDILESDAELQKNFLAAHESVWIRLFVILMITMAIIMVMVNLLGCVGSCVLSYSLLSGFTTFMLMSMIFAVTSACLFFIPLSSSNSRSMELLVSSHDL